MKKIILVSLFVMSISQNAFSWGRTGHRIVGEIAQRNLSASTLQSIK